MAIKGVDNEVIESMTRIEWKGLTIRVWGCENEISFRYHLTEARIRKGLSKITGDTFDAKQVIKAILEANIGWPDIAAIEILDESKNGIVYYPDWS